MDLEGTFEGIGGKINSPIDQLKERLLSSKSIVFDWDGVFNDGSKDPARGSVFSEVDAMGTNLFRFSYWLKHGELPVVAVMSGATNPIAIELATREHFDVVFTKSINKKLTYSSYLDEKKIQLKESIFVYDDVLDLGITHLGGINIQIKRSNNPLLNDFVSRNGLSDYETALPGGQNAVREACELLIGLHENYDEAVEKRSEFHDDYAQYLETRNKVEVQVREG